MDNRIGIISDNSAGVIMKMLELWGQKKTVVLINGDTPIDALKYIIVENKIEICFCCSKEVRKYEEYDLGIMVVEYSQMSSNLLYTDSLVNYLSPESDEVALVLYSSGTTGRAKGIMLSHKAINENADAIIKYMSPKKDDIFCILKNLVHSSTIVGEVLVAIKCGCAIYCVTEHNNIRFMVEELHKSKATIACINPTILCLLMKMTDSYLNQKLINLKKIYVSGAILNKSLLIHARKILSHCRIFNVYGMTECGPRITSQELASNIDNNSVGKPLYGVQIRLLGFDGELIRNYDVLGRIEVKTPYRCEGYSSGQGLPMDSDGWLDTGDIGYFDFNRNLYITGRLDNMIICYGHNVYPESIEEIIRCVPGVEECLVIGDKNVVAGYTLCCYYKGDIAIRGNIYKACKKALLPHEIPKRFVAVESFQYKNGKINRKQFEE